MSDTTENPVKKKTSKEPKTYQADKHRIREIDVNLIVSNRKNPRESVPNLSKHGYGVFEKIPGSDKPAVVSLALSDDQKQKDEFVYLVEKWEPELKDLAADLKINGFIHPCLVRNSEEGGYDLEVGCRRTLATLYNHVAHGDKPSIMAVITDDDDDKAYFKSFSENAHRKQMSPIEEAQWYNSLRKIGLQTKEIADKVGVDKQNVINRLKLLQLDEETQDKIHKGEVGWTVAIKKVKEEGEEKKSSSGGGGGGGGGRRKTVPTRKDFLAMYNDDASLSEPVREFIAKTILRDVEYVTFKELQRMKKEAEK